jgi:hypothetical protein
MAGGGGAALRTPTFTVERQLRRVVCRKHDGTTVSIGPDLIKTPDDCTFWKGDGRIKAWRCGYAEVVFTKTDVPVDVVVGSDEVVVEEPAMARQRHEW